MIYEIVILAMIAAFLGLRLYSVLGRRAEHEEEPIPQRFDAGDGAKAPKPALTPGQQTLRPQRELAGVPAALDWLDSVKSPPELNKDGKTYPTFLEIGTDKPIYVHRRGSNVVNGEYYVDGNPADTLGHYSSFRHLDVPKLRREYEALKALPPEVASKDSPLKATGRRPLDRYYLTDMGAGSDRNADLAAFDSAHRLLWTMIGGVIHEPAGT